MTDLNYKSIIKNIVNHAQEKLNDWGLDFVSGVYNSRVLGDMIITEKQKEVVKKINRKYIAVR